jgi:hypothetical protein
MNNTIVEVEGLSKSGRRTGAGRGVVLNVFAVHCMYTAS